MLKLILGFLLILSAGWMVVVVLTQSIHERYLDMVIPFAIMKGLVGLGFMMWGALSQGREHRVLRDDARRGFAVLPPRLEQSGNSPHSAASPEFSG